MEAVPVLGLVLSLSVLLQILAAVLALRLIPLSHGRLAWILVALAQVMMAARRATSLVRLADGRRHPVDPWAEAMALAISASMVLAMWLIGRLFAERRELEEQLRQAEKMEALGRLAGGVAHDFNNHLLVIMGHADELERSAADPAAREGAEAILGAARRSAALTRNLLTFARKAPRQSARVDVHALITETEEVLRRTFDRRIEIGHDLRAEPSSVNGDSSHLQAMLLNLAINGRDAMPNGGRLTLSTSIVLVGEGAGAFRHRDLGPGRYLAICVTDTGTGIDAATRPHLFEPFFTTKPSGKGTGLGLASVYATVRAHHGAVDVDSAPGRGATFRVLLPIPVGLAPATALPEPERRTPRPSSRGARILVIEDEDAVRDVLVAMLRRLGHEPVACPDGARAVELYAREWRDTDLVIVDTLMPQLGGEETLTALTRINPEARVIVCSGYSAEGLPGLSPVKGMVGFLHKPFVQDELATVLERVLPPRGARPEQTARQPA